MWISSRMCIGQFLCTCWELQATEHIVLLIHHCHNRVSPVHIILTFSCISYKQTLRCFLISYACDIIVDFLVTSLQTCSNVRFLFELHSIYIIPIYSVLRMYSAFGKSLCTYKRCWKWCPRVSILAWTHLILFANTFCRSEFGNLLCIYKRCWKWCPRAFILAWTSLILFANTFCRSAFGKLLCTYNRHQKWCPRNSVQAWTRLILFTNTFCRSAFGKSLCTYKRCWKWCPRASIQAWNQIYVL
jgi:hypothetical protein